MEGELPNIALTEARPSQGTYKEIPLALGGDWGCRTGHGQLVHGYHNRHALWYTGRHTARNSCRGELRLLIRESGLHSTGKEDITVQPHAVH